MYGFPDCYYGNLNSYGVFLYFTIQERGHRAWISSGKDRKHPLSTAVVARGSLPGFTLYHIRRWRYISWLFRSSTARNSKFQITRNSERRRIYIWLVRSNYILLGSEKILLSDQVQMLEPALICIQFDLLCQMLA